MASSEDNNDPFYELYKNAGLVPVEIVTNGIIALLCLVGVCLNASLVNVITKTKSLHSPCNILIGLYAFFASFLLIGSSIKFFVFLFGINYISLRSCFYLQIVLLIGADLSIGMQLFIGLDRLSGVCFPLWYKSSGKFVLFKVMIVCCCVKGVVCFLIAFYCSSKQWERPVMCNFGDPMRLLQQTTRMTDILFNAIYGTEILCYASLWLCIFLRRAQISQNRKRLMISLTVIMSISLICLFGNSLFFNVVMPMFNFNIFTIEYVIFPICRSFMIVSYCSGAPVLFSFSEMYRREFYKCFGPTRQQQNVVHVVQSAVTTHHQDAEIAN